MEKYGHKINKAKWNLQPFMRSNSDISADAITGCLKTLDNKLSCWRCSSNKISLKEIALAIVLASDGFFTIDIFCFYPEDINRMNIEIDDESEGDTPIRHVRECHIDLINLTLEKLNLLAEHIASNYRADPECVRRFTISKVKKMVRAAYRKNWFDPEEVNERLKPKVNKLLGIGT